MIYGNWILLLLVALSLVTTAAIWFRFRRLPELRPWLVRHVIGNVVLAIGLAAAVFFEVGFICDVAIIVAILGMWVSDNRKLRAAIRNTRRNRRSHHYGHRRRRIVGQIQCVITGA